MQVTANGKTFEFPDGTSTDDVGTAIDEYFAGQSVPATPDTQPVTDPQTTQRDRNFISDAALGVTEAGRAVVQAGVDTANILPMATDAVKSAAAWAGEKVGLGDGTFNPSPRLSLPEQLKPQTTAGQIASDILPFLINPASKAPAAAGNLAERGVNFAARMLGESAVGSAAANSSNPNIDQATGDTLKDLALNAGVGGAVRGVTNAVGAGYRGVRGAMSPEADQAVRFAEQNNIPLLTTDVAQPGTFTGRSAQALGEKIPVTGTGGVRRAQQEARGQLVQQYSERFAPPAPEEIVQSLRRQTNRVKQAAGQRLTQVNDAMEPVGAIQPTQAISAIDTEITRLRRLGGAADTQTINRLQTYRDELDRGADFGLLRDLRTQFRQDVRGDRVVWPNQSQAAVNRVYAALTNDVDKAVADNLGPQVANRYRQANAAYANEAQLVNNTRLKNVLQKGDLTPEVANNLLFSNKPSEVRQLYLSLDNRGRHAARASVIGKAYEKSGGSPDKFLNEINRLSSQTGILFRGEERQYLNGLSTYLDQTRRAARAGAVTPTGQELLQVAVPAGVASDVIGTGGVGTATALSYGALARAYESKPVRNAMLRLANTPAGHSAFERNIKRAADAVAAATRGYASGDQ
ncbi:lytic transglycosylase domain-containing protein [Serratia fonticola]|uniref:lytic transglycosylase domain-containing protein n=1 Tax=Serratia fonticola TaxID=47917 RepID=UPI001645296A|nr:lytic transglycosylase domain-containing protein [Serratia fonticola]MBC3251214.1 lytic transglycosylase domain-containing protein [Serratia fonticola]